ncbi:hypothetical protein KW805_01185 [Candidatus Pacearchaeota archaeon]|nr:hypothetical protein [Candidatus Pacearchaeota archaeon]
MPDRIENLLDAYVDGKRARRDSALQDDKTRKPNGYWNNIKNIVKEARTFKKKHKLKQLPGATTIRELGGNTLVAAIMHHVGMRKFRDTMGEEQREAEKGVWKNKDYALQEARRIMHENNLTSLPSQYTLNQMKQGGLVRAIQIYHGGFRKFRDDLGQSQVLRKRGLWNNIRYVLKEARVIKERHGFKQLPGGETLAKLGYSAFNNAVWKYHGGMNNIRKKLDEELPRTDSSLLKDETYILKQARKIMRDEGYETLPGHDSLYKKGYASFTNAVNRHHGGIAAIRKKLGQEINRKSNSYWKKWRNVHNALKEIVNELGHFPKQKELQKRESSIAAAITLHHGGMNTVREKMGYERTKLDNGFYKDSKNIEQDMQKIIKTHTELQGTLPSAHWLQKNGYASLSNGIRQIYGSYGEYRKQKGLPESLQVELGRWKDLEFTLQQAQEFMEEEGLTELPGSWTMNRKGYSSLGAAITKYHGGIKKFRERLYLRIGKSPPSSQLESVLLEYAGGNDD